MPRSTMWHDGVKITASSRRGGGLLGVLIGLVVLVLAARFLGSAAEAALVGVRDSAAEANRVIAYAVAALVAAGAVVGAWWLVSGRPAQRRRDEIAAEHSRAVSADVAARQIERARARHLEQGRRAALERADRPTASPTPVALPWDREPVELDGRWSA